MGLSVLLEQIMATHLKISTVFSDFLYAPFLRRRDGKAFEDEYYSHRDSLGSRFETLI